MDVEQRTKLAMSIFQKTRHGLDLHPEATIYEFPLGLRDLTFNLPKKREKLQPLEDIKEELRYKLKNGTGSKCKPMLVQVKSTSSLGVCLAQPHSFDQKSCTTAVIQMSNPNQAPVRVGIEKLIRVCWGLYNSSLRAVAEKNSGKNNTRKEIDIHLASTVHLAVACYCCCCFCSTTTLTAIAECDCNDGPGPWECVWRLGHQGMWEYIVWTGKSTVSAKTKMTFETMIADPSQQQQ